MLSIAEHLALYMLWFSWSVLPLLRNFYINEVSPTKTKPVLTLCKRIVEKLLCVFSRLIISFLYNFKTHMNPVIFSMIYFCRNQVYQWSYNAQQSILRKKSRLCNSCSFFTLMSLTIVSYLASTSLFLSIMQSSSR